MLLKIVTAVAAGIAAWLAYFVNDLISKRRSIAGLVSYVPMHYALDQAFWSQWRIIAS